MTPAPAAAEERAAPQEIRQIDKRAYQHFALVLGAGWLFTTLGYAIADLPLKFLLKDGLGLQPEAVAVFFAIGNFTNYIKPLAGVLTDAVPLLGTRRKSYLVLGLFACGMGWLLLGIVPRTYVSLLATYTAMYVTVVLISTTLGGVMAEGGDRFRASGRLSAHRVGIFRLVALIGAPVGGWLATKDFLITVAITAALHFGLIPLLAARLQEEPVRRNHGRAWSEIQRQGRVLMESRTLWAAGALIFLVNLEPGFNTPLLYFQTDTLKFDKPFVGMLGMVAGASGLLGALLFGRFCSRIRLRALIIVGILIQVFSVLLFLGYRSRDSALIITVVYSAAQTLSLLPLYDLAIRATPRGSEALGYSLMMSVFNIALALSDVIGSMLYTRGLTLHGLVWLNAGTTSLVLLAVPLLPRALTDRRDGEPAADIQMDALE